MHQWNLTKGYIIDRLHLRYEYKCFLFILCVLKANVSYVVYRYTSFTLHYIMSSFRLLEFGLKAMTISLHIEEVLFCTGGLTIVKKFKLISVVMIHWLIRYSFPTVNLGGIVTFQDMECP
jgi:hypothetical protein